MSLPPGWQADIIKGLGGTHTAGAEHLLGAWQQWEGGGTANKATFNPLNTTIGKYPKINSVGVSAFPDWQTGVAETVSTLGSYPALSDALRTGKIDFNDPRLQADFNYWLTGKRTPGMTPYVAKIARSYGHDVPLSETRALTNSVPPPPPVVAKAEAPAKKLISLMDIALGKKSIMDMFFQKRPSAAAPAAAPAPAYGATVASSTAGAGQGGWTPMPKDSNWASVTPPTRGTASVADAALKWLGTSYSWGGGGPKGPSEGFAQGAGIKGFDCSSLLQYAYAKQGVDVPRVTYDQWKTGQAVPPQALSPGDAVFFNMGSRGPEHVGIYMGNDKFIEAPRTGLDVRVSKLSDRDDYVGARRYG